MNFEELAWRKPEIREMSSETECDGFYLSVQLRRERFCIMKKKRAER